jgi:hypothetical protein
MINQDRQMEFGGKQIDLEQPTNYFEKVSTDIPFNQSTRVFIGGGNKLYEDGWERIFGKGKQCTKQKK